MVEMVVVVVCIRQYKPSGEFSGYVQVADPAVAGIMEKRRREDPGGLVDGRSAQWCSGPGNQVNSMSARRRHVEGLHGLCRILRNQRKRESLLLIERNSDRELLLIVRGRRCPEYCYLSIQLYAQCAIGDYHSR